MEEQDEPNPEDDEEFLETLGFEETRVLGSLIEKELTTPEYYPMSLNGLVNACNQKNNRLPRSELSEEEVGRAIEELRIKRLVHRVDLVGSRVPKFQHNAEKELDLIKAERALLSELLNRGPQTTGELNGRAGRMFEFDGLSDVEETLREMEERQPPLVGQMDPAPGKRSADGITGSVRLPGSRNCRTVPPYTSPPRTNDWIKWKKWYRNSRNSKKRSKLFVINCASFPISSRNSARNSSKNRPP